LNLTSALLLVAVGGAILLSIVLLYFRAVRRRVEQLTEDEELSYRPEGEEYPEEDAPPGVPLKALPDAEDGAQGVPLRAVPDAEEQAEAEAADVRGEPEPDQQPALEPTPPAPAAPPVKQPPALRWAGGLAKTRSVFAGLGALRRKEKIEEADWEEVEEALIRADVGVRATTRIMESLKARKPTPASLTDVLKEELVGVLGTGNRDLTLRLGEPAVWLVSGVNGVGKTTSIAKLARKMMDEGHSVVLAAGDTFRAAAIEQLQTWAQRLGVHVVKHAPGADPGAVVFDAITHAKARGVDVVIIDTAGRLHTKSNLMDELRKVRRIADRESGGVSESLLVLDGTVGQNGLLQARAFKEAVGATGVVLTKLDGSARGGIVIAVQEELGLPVKVVGVGEGIDDLETFDPERFVTALID
jgi:fused signal recognition particle receptor